MDRIVINGTQFIYDKHYGLVEYDKGYQKRLPQKVYDANIGMEFEVIVTNRDNFPSYTEPGEYNLESGPVFLKDRDGTVFVCLSLNAEECKTTRRVLFDDWKDMYGNDYSKWRQ